MGDLFGGGSQQTGSGPPKWQLPYIKYGTEEAKNIYQNQPGVVPFSPETEQALGGITARATNNQLTGAQQNLATQTLNGGFLGANPYLDQTFNRAAQATQGQLASQFAGAGRNVDQSQGNRAQQLNDLSAQIYGGAYNQERQLQNQVLGMSPSLQQAGYADLNQLATVGAAREGLQQERNDYAGGQLDQYLGRVSGNAGQYGTVSRNRGAGALGGAMMGSQLGGQYGYGGWGALLGGILGGWG